MPDKENLTIPTPAALYNLFAPFVRTITDTYVPKGRLAENYPIQLFMKEKHTK